MKKILYIIILVSMVLPGCIRRSDQGFAKKVKTKNTQEKINLKRITANLMVSDINKSISFYKDVCGLEPTVYYPDSQRVNFVILSKGNTSVMLQKIENFTEEFPEYKDKNPWGTFNLYFEVNDVLMIYEKAISKTSIVKELHQTLFGTKEFTVKDNDGYVITFAETIKR